MSLRKRLAARGRWSNDKPLRLTRVALDAVDGLDYRNTLTLPIGIYFVPYHPLELAKGAVGGCHTISPAACQT